MIRDDVTGDPQQVILFVQRSQRRALAPTFRAGVMLLFIPWRGGAARGQRTDPAGGVADLLDLETRETIAWTDTNGWLARTLATPRAKRRGC